jgi:tetratricopeptide (TPR) repeat protein
MNLDDEDRVAHTPPPAKDHSFVAWGATLVVVLLLAFIASPELRDYARQQAYGVGSLVGIVKPDSRFAPVYKRLGMAPLPVGLAASEKIAPNLAKLAAEPCDKEAIFALAEALLVDKEKRDAAKAYLGFSATCPNSTGEEFRAAQILFLLGDNQSVVTAVTEIIAKTPGVADYYYLRGRAMAGLKRYDEALADYTSTIKFQGNARNIRSKVFVEMANIYLATGKPCEAAAIIVAWVALDPKTRNTPAAHNMIEEYNERGCAQRALPRPEAKKL